MKLLEISNAALLLRGAPPTRTSTLGPLPSSHRFSALSRQMPESSCYSASLRALSRLCVRIGPDGRASGRQARGRFGYRGIDAEHLIESGEAEKIVNLGL